MKRVGETTFRSWPAKLPEAAWAGLRPMPLRLMATYAGIGILVATHWLAFYASIKLSNASVAATCMALTPVFIAFVEPFLAGRRFDPRHPNGGGARLRERRGRALEALAFATGLVAGRHDLCAGRNDLGDGGE